MVIQDKGISGRYIHISGYSGKISKLRPTSSARVGLSGKGWSHNSSMKKKQPKKKKAGNSDTIKKRILKNQEEWLVSYKKRWTITAACLETGIVRDTYYQWIKKYPKFKERVARESNTQQDYVETKLVESINQMNIAAIIFWLKHRHPEYRIDQFRFKGELESKLELTDAQFNQLITSLKKRARDSAGEKGSEGKTD